MHNTYTHTHTPDIIFLFSSRGDVHKNDARVISDCLLNSFQSGVGRGRWVRRILQRLQFSGGGGPLVSQHCFALLCSLERGFFLTLLTMWRMVGRGLWYGMVWYGCTSTCRQVQVVSELGMESSPTRSIPTVSRSTYVGAGARGSFEIGVRYKSE